MARKRPDAATFDKPDWSLLSVQLDSAISAVASTAARVRSELTAQLDTAIAGCRRTIAGCQDNLRKAVDSVISNARVALDGSRETLDTQSIERIAGVIVSAAGLPVDLLAAPTLPPVGTAAAANDARRVQSAPVKAVSAAAPTDLIDAAMSEWGNIMPCCPQPIPPGTVTELKYSPSLDTYYANILSFDGSTVHKLVCPCGANKGFPPGQTPPAGLAPGVQTTPAAPLLSSQPTQEREGPDKIDTSEDECPCPTYDENGCLCVALSGFRQFEPPVDVDQPLAFKFLPDDIPIKQGALAWIGISMAEFLASQSFDDYNAAVLGSIIDNTPPVLGPFAETL